MKANGHLDEGAARLLLDRATIKRDDGSLEFSRDIKVKITVICDLRCKKNINLYLRPKFFII